MYYTLDLHWGHPYFTVQPYLSNQTLFVTCAEYNKCRLYCGMHTYKPLTNSAVQEELRKHLQSYIKL
jgi:hypothetical protein